MMQKFLRRPLALLAMIVVAMSGCASSPVNYYTLVRSSPAELATAMILPAFAFDLESVSVPLQVDQPQLVVRQAGAGIALVETERWIAPLGDEIRDAIASDLVASHSGENLAGLPQADRKLIKIRVDLRRFDSQPGFQASITASWSLRRAPGDSAAMSCSSRIVESVGAGYDALVQGHQRALARLAAAIAKPASAMANNGSPACPAEADE